MATQSELSDLVARRKAAAEARKAARVAPPVIEENPDVVDDDDKQAVVTRATSLPVAPMKDLSRQLERGDIVMPKLKISQAMSKVNTEDTVRQGNWYISTSNRNLGSTVYVVPIDMQKSYSCFLQGKGVVCRSFDLRQGIGDPGVLCEGTDEEIAAGIPKEDRGCELRLWTEDPTTGRRKPPPCGLNYNYPVLVLDPDDLKNGRATPAVLSMRSTSAKVAKIINSMVTDGILTEPVWHEVIVKLTLERATNAAGQTYFVPVASYFGETSGDVEAQAVRMAANINGSVVRRSLENDDTE